MGVMENEKTLLRKRMKSLRATYCGADPSEAQRSEHLVAGYFCDVFLPYLWEEFFSSRERLLVSGYCSIYNELDPLPLMALLEKQGHVGCLPKVEKGKETLSFYPWSVGGSLEKDAAGILSPLSTRFGVYPDVILVPLLAFDCDGHRLGYGKGFYDKTLKALEDQSHIFTTVGLAFSFQKVDCLPKNARDMALDWIITEKDIFYPSKANRR